MLPIVRIERLIKFNSEVVPLRATKHNSFSLRDQLKVEQPHEQVSGGDPRTGWTNGQSAANSEPPERPLSGDTGAQMMIEPEQLPLSRSDIIELLHQAEVMPTSQRVQIAEVLFSKSQHLSAEQILDQVSKLGHSISRATIYNTLGLFSSKGLVKQVIIDPDRVLYDPHTAPHHHFFNADTGKLTDIKSNTIELKKMPDLPENTSLSNIDVVFEVREKS